MVVRLAVSAATERRGEGLAGAADEEQGADAALWRRWCSRGGCGGWGWWRGRRWGRGRCRRWPVGEAGGALGGGHAVDLIAEGERESRRGGCSKSHMRGAGLRKLMAAMRRREREQFCWIVLRLGRSWGGKTRGPMVGFVLSRPCARRKAQERGTVHLRGMGFSKCAYTDSGTHSCGVLRMMGSEMPARSLSVETSL
jgi:hypothetical protein